MKSGKKNPTPNSAEGQKKGEARDIVAKNVGLRSGHEVDRAIKAIDKNIVQFESHQKIIWWLLWW